MKEKNTAKIYNNLLNFLFNRKYEEGYVKNHEYIFEGVYNNLQDSFLEYFTNEKYFDFGIFEDLLIYDIYSKWLQKQASMSDVDIKYLLNKMRKTFELNKAEHFLLIPMPKLKLEEIITTDQFSIIPRSFNDDEKIAHIARITGIKLEKVTETLRHTKSSRSVDFLSHAILIFHHVGQSDSIKSHSASIAKGIVFSLRAYYYGEIYEVDENISDDLDILNLYSYEPNSHLAILSKDDWREGFGVIPYSAECNFSVDFLHDPIHMENYTNLLNQLVLSEGSEKSIERLFYGSLLTFNKSLDLINEKSSQSTSLAVLLMITTAETLLAHENNGNRMKVRVLLPRFVGSDDLLKRSDIVLSMEELYKMRNSYAHAGIESRIKEIDGELNYYNVAKKSLGKLICMYPKFCIEKNEAKWDDFLREKFNAGIDGEF